MFEIGGRRVRIGAFPVAIETESFARRARHAMRTNFMKDFRASLGDKKMVLGVDRLDIRRHPNRLEAFESLLSTAPEWHQRVTFVQITPKSRTEVPEYVEMDRYLSTKAGQINGAFGDVSWTPLRYVNKTYSPTALAGLYRTADVAMVTPCRDGMNLVAKEFVPHRIPRLPACFCLSQFAGAAAENGRRALMVKSA